MRLKRRGKSKGINPQDFGLEELSKINKDNVVRVMDRSKERTGERIAEETGLFVPKRDLYEMMKVSGSDSYDENLVRREKGDLLREKYSYGKAYAFGEEYINTEANYTPYDDYTDTDSDEDDDFSVEDFSLKDFLDSKDNAGYHKEKSEESRKFEEITEERVEESRRFEENAEERAEETRRFEEVEEERIEESRSFEEENVKISDSSMNAQIALFEALYKRADQAEELRKKTATVLDDEVAVDETELYSEKYDEVTQHDVKYGEEKQAEVIRYSENHGEEDDTTLVRPELLDEIGFTPGGEEEPEIVKNKRFRFGGRKKKKSSVEISPEEISETKKKLQTASTIAEKQVNEKLSSDENVAKKTAMPRESRSEAMRNPETRVAYVKKYKSKLEKASQDLMKMQEKYDDLTECINDMVRFSELPENVERNIKSTAEMIVRYRLETEKTKKGCDMDDVVFRRMDQNKEELPDVIKRLTENEKYADKLKNTIDRLEEEKEECREEHSESEEKRRKTKNISIAVMIVTVITMAVLFVLQIFMEMDVQIAILLFGVCVILETLGIFVQHFKTETDETTNHYKLNKLIKKQNTQKVKFVNLSNAVEYVYKKYNVHSSSELLFQWESYQRTVQAREDYAIAGKEVIYYEDRLLNIMSEYSFSNPEVWISQVEYLTEEKSLEDVREELVKKRTKLITRMEKCKRVIGRLDNELSVLVIKFPQYADEIKGILDEI